MDHALAVVDEEEDVEIAWDVETRDWASMLDDLVSGKQKSWPDGADYACLAVDGSEVSIRAPKEMSCLELAQVATIMHSKKIIMIVAQRPIGQFVDGKCSACGHAKKGPLGHFCKLTEAETRAFVDAVDLAFEEPTMAKSPSVHYPLERTFLEEDKSLQGRKGKTVEQIKEDIVSGKHYEPMVDARSLNTSQLMFSSPPPPQPVEPKAIIWGEDSEEEFSLRLTQKGDVLETPRQRTGEVGEFVPFVMPKGRIDPSLYGNFPRSGHFWEETVEVKAEPVVAPVEVPVVVGPPVIEPPPVIVVPVEPIVAPVPVGLQNPYMEGSMNHRVVATLLSGLALTTKEVATAAKLKLARASQVLSALTNPLHNVSGRRAGLAIIRFEGTWRATAVAPDPDAKRIRKKA